MREIILTQKFIEDINSITTGDLKFTALGKGITIDTLCNKAKLLGVELINLGETIALLDNSGINILGTKFKVINGYALFHHRDFNSIDLTELDTQSMRMADSMFIGCNSNEVNFGHLDMSNVKSMRNMFLYANIKRININNINICNVEDMSYMFERAYTEELTLSNLDIRNVRDMSYMFKGLRAITINMKGLNINNVVKMRHMFFSFHGNLVTDNAILKDLYDSRLFDKFD